MKSHKTLILLFFYSSCMLGQLSDQFTDGNFNVNPNWYGDTSDYIVNNQFQLQLNSNKGGISSLCTSVALHDSIRWEFYVNLTFSTSASNNLKVYLLLDTVSTESANGYYVEVGQNGSPDPIQFYVLEDGISHLLGSSEFGFSEEVNARISVTREKQGLWALYITSENSVTQEIMRVTDNSYSPSSNNQFCIECMYSASRGDKFFFDDISITPLLPDTIPPQLVTLTVLDSSHISLTFSELITSNINSENINITPSIGDPLTIKTDQNQLILTLKSKLLSGTEYTCTLNQITDTSGNTSLEQKSIFTYWKLYQPTVGDLIINELLIDETPSIGLPEAEYIELFNTTSKALNLDSAYLLVNSTKVLLSGTIILPKDYLLLVDKKNIKLMDSTWHLYAQENLPALTNTSGNIALHRKDGLLLHELEYTEHSYMESSKSGGGWSLEMINPFNPCVGKLNWRASEHWKGGTPNAKNSVLDITNASSLSPTFESTSFYPTKNQVSFHFDRTLSSITLTAVTIEPETATFESETEGNQIKITLLDKLDEGDQLTAIIRNINSCIGNSQTDLVLDFGIPIKPVKGDIIINEILADPNLGDSPFIELYNTTPSYFYCGDLAFATINEGEIQIESNLGDYLIPPFSIIAFSEDRLSTISQYFTHDVLAIIESNLPSIKKDVGSVVLLSKMGIALDSIAYSEDYHHVLIDDSRGISLERISPFQTAYDAYAWHSASAQSGWATPGVQNSQYVNLDSVSQVYKLEHHVFSPNGDGYRDFLLLQFNEEAFGDIANVMLFDENGREVSTILNNALIGNGSIVKWDGSNGTSEPASTGIYIMIIQLMGNSGEVRIYKEAVVLADGF